jgi:hypothetical protein
MTFLYQAHSGLRFLVLLAGLGALIALAIGGFTGRPVRAARGLTAAFTGLLDLQVLLGLALVIGGIFYGALMGHLTLMLVAAVAAHVAGVRARKAGDERQANRLRLIGVAVALLCIVLGVAAIGRGIFGTAPATLGA